MNKSVLNNQDPTLQEMFYRRDNGKCPLCGNEVKVSDFHDDLSLKEFKLSGLCPTCQRGFFDE